MSTPTFKSEVRTVHITNELILKRTADFKITQWSFCDLFWHVKSPRISQCCVSGTLHVSKTVRNYSTTIAFYRP